MEMENKPIEDDEQVGFLNSNIEVPENVKNQDPDSHRSNKSCGQSMFKCLMSKTKLTKDERVSFYKLKTKLQPRYDEKNNKHVKRLNYLVLEVFGDKNQEVINNGYKSDDWEKIGF